MERALICKLQKLPDGGLRLLMEDGQSLGADVWASQTLFTQLDFSLDASGEILNLSPQTLSELGENVLIRLLANRGGGA